MVTSINVEKTNTYLAKVDQYNPKHLVGINKKGELIDLGSNSQKGFHNRRSIQYMHKFLKEQQLSAGILDPTSDTKKNMSERKVQKIHVYTFTQLKSQLEKLKKTEAFVLQERCENIKTIIDSTSEKHSNIERCAETIANDILEHVTDTPQDMQASALTKLFIVTLHKLSESSLSRQQKEVIIAHLGKIHQKIPLPEHLQSMLKVKTYESDNIPTKEDTHASIGRKILNFVKKIVFSFFSTSAHQAKQSLEANFKDLTILLNRITVSPDQKVNQINIQLLAEAIHLLDSCFVTYQQKNDNKELLFVMQDTIEEKIADLKRAVNESRKDKTKRQSASSKSEITTPETAPQSSKSDTVNQQKKSLLQNTNHATSTTTPQKKAMDTEELRNNRVESGLAPGLKNWGCTCFVNGYLNFLMLSLEPKDIEALSQLNKDTMTINAANQEEKIEPIALELRDCMIRMWQAYHNPTPDINFASLQKEFLILCTRCGNERRGNNLNIPTFFAEAFPSKSEQELTSTRVSFGNIAQQDSNELQVALYDLLLSRIPSSEKVNYQRTKFVNYFGQPATYKKQEQLVSGLNLRVKNDSGSFYSSMQEGLSSLEKTFQDEVNWTKEELVAANVDTDEGGYLPSSVKEETIIDSQSKKLTVKIDPYYYDGHQTIKVNKEAIAMFANGGNPLKVTVHDAKTNETSEATFVPRTMICHVGKTANSGHYFALSFQKNGDVIVHDDTHVFKLTDNSKTGVVAYLHERGATPRLIDYRRS